MNGIQEKPKCESAQDVSLPIGTEKKCTKCCEIKKLNDYHKCRKGKYGRRSVCKDCKKKIRKLEHLTRKDIENRQSKLWRKANLEKMKVLSKQWYENNIVECRAKRLLYLKNNESRARVWQAKSREKIKHIPCKRINKIISSSICNAIKGKKQKTWQILVGYTLEELIDHLERQFVPGMSWGNYGRYGWHIDHKIPISAFNFEKPEDIDFKRCWGLKNLQPMWAKDNLIKYNKLAEPFQPSLAISI